LHKSESTGRRVAKPFFTLLSSIPAFAQINPFFVSTIRIP